MGVNESRCMNRIHALGWRGAVAMAFFLSGCSSSERVPKTVDKEDPIPVSIVEGATPTENQQDRMLAAKEALFKKLSARLMEVMTSQGPAAAILVCQKEAPKIAVEVSEEHGLQIGRTGVRLRNPNNAAPQWAIALTQAGTDTPTFATLNNGHAAALLPIKLQTQCLVCHGPKQTIAPVIQEQLSKLYPDDQATGFEEGELRGWFWVELADG